MLRCVTLLILLLGLSFVACELGSINVAFTDEDPATGEQVSTTLVIGQSIEVTIILTPAPQIPVRIDVVSTNPTVVYPTHKTITFNRGVSRGIVTLESPDDGKLGTATILISPEKLGLYRPTSFNVVVQGIATIVLLDNCVAASKPASFAIQLSPESPDNGVFTVTATNGVVSSETIVLNTGDVVEEFTFTGTAIGPSSITIESGFYVEYTIEFQTLGRILTDVIDRRAVEGAPESVLVTVNPLLTGTQTVTIDTIAQNANVIPSTFVVDADGTHIEVVPIFYGLSNVTYVAPDYCPLTNIYTVAEAPMCALNSHPNVLGGTCYVCPGNLASLPTIVNNCNNHGECKYTHCFTNEVTCGCDEGYVGYACQWDAESQEFEFESAVLNNQPFVLELDFFTYTIEPIELSAPGNLIAPALQPGLAISALYPFFGAIDPADNPPMGAEYTGISFYWENTCYENAYIPNNFTAPVVTKIPLDSAKFTHRDLLEIQLCLWNSTGSGHWVDSIEACNGAGFPGQRTMDLHSFTFTTMICQPGQYALFIIPISSPVPNTGNTNDPHPTIDDFSDTFFLVSTGWQPAPPLPLPIVAAEFDPSPPLPIVYGSDSSASALLLSLSVVLLAFLLHL